MRKKKGRTFPKKKKGNKYGLAKKTPEQLVVAMKEDEEFINYCHARAFYGREQLEQKRQREGSTRLYVS